MRLDINGIGEVSSLISELKNQGVNVVSFDFDLTLTKAHLFDRLGDRDEPIQATQFEGEEHDDLRELCKNALVDHEFTRLLFEELQKNNIKVVINSLGVKGQIKQVLEYAQIPFDDIFAAESKFDGRDKRQKWSDFMSKPEYLNSHICHFDDENGILDFFDTDRTKKTLAQCEIIMDGVKVRPGTGMCFQNIGSLLRQLVSNRQEEVADLYGSRSDTTLPAGLSFRDMVTEGRISTPPTTSR